MILTKTNTQAKYQDGISYHLLLCFLAENETVSSFQVNEATNVVLFYQRNCLKSLFSVS